MMMMKQVTKDCVPGSVKKFADRFKGLNLESRSADLDPSDFVLYDKGTVVKESPIHGRGLFASCDIKAGAPILVECALVSKRTPIAMREEHMQILCASYFSAVRGDLFSFDHSRALYPRLDKITDVKTCMKDIQRASILNGVSLDVASFIDGSPVVALNAALIEKANNNRFFFDSFQVEKPKQYLWFKKRLSDFTRRATSEEPVLPALHAADAEWWNGEHKLVKKQQKTELENGGGYVVLPFKACMINSASLLDDGERLNAAFTIDTDDSPAGTARFIVFATRNICAGEEIFIHYGDGYNANGVVNDGDVTMAKFSESPQLQERARNYSTKLSAMEALVVNVIRKAEPSFAAKDVVHKRAKLIVDRARVLFRENNDNTSNFSGFFLAHATVALTSYPDWMTPVPR
jgi:hypothetical protein